MVLATKNLVKIALNTIIGAILVIIWLQFVDLGEIFANLTKVNVVLLTPVFIFLLLSPAIRALRLKIFLAPIKKLSLKDLIFLNGAATMLNFLIPLRGGEIAKGFYLHQVYHLPLSKSLIWIFLDRFIDFLAVLILATGLFFLIPTSLPFSFITIIIFIIFIIVILIYLMVYKSYFAKKIFLFLKHLLIVNIIKIYFYRIINHLLESLAILKRKPLDLIYLLFLTILAYAADGAIWYFTFLAIGSSEDYLKMYLGQLLSALTYLIPAAPGYVGSAEASGLLILSGVLGIEANLASSMIVLFHILSAVFLLVFGLVAIYFLKINLSLILKQVLRRG